MVGAFLSHKQWGREVGGCWLRFPNQQFIMSKETCRLMCLLSILTQSLGVTFFLEEVASFLSVERLSCHVASGPRRQSHIPFLSSWRCPWEGNAAVSQNKYKIDFQSPHIICFSPTNSKIDGSKCLVMFAGINSKDYSVSPWGWAWLSHRGKNDEQIFRTAFWIELSGKK